LKTRLKPTAKTADLLQIEWVVDPYLCSDESESKILC
jgi:hypothetical protein